MIIESVYHVLPKNTNRRVISAGGLQLNICFHHYVKKQIHELSVTLIFYSENG